MASATFSERELHYLPRVVIDSSPQNPIVSSTVHPFSPPLLYDEITNEPYLPLSPPHGPRIRITPPRFSDPSSSSSPNGDGDGDGDIDALVRILNLPEVYVWLRTPPKPFLRKHAIDCLKNNKQQWEES